VLPEPPPAETPSEPPPASPLPAHGRDLLLYLAAGLGLFVLLGLVFARQAIPAGMLASLAGYIANFVVFAGAAYLLAVRRLGLTWRQFGLRPFAWQWLVAALALALAITPVRIGLALVVLVFTGGLQQLQPRMDVFVPGAAFSGVNFAVTLLGAGVLAPIAEELYFRGLLHGWFWARFPARPWLRLGLSSALFALGHFDSPAVAVSSFFLGAICAGAYERGRSLWLPILIHVSNNSLSVILVYAVLALQRLT
jgi:membrane protease YdiL (CAAX protease family)